MKITELKDWDKLTPEEQARLREMYQVDEEDNLPDSYVAHTESTPLVPDLGDDQTIVINTENVIVNENVKREEDHG